MKNSENFFFPPRRNDGKFFPLGGGSRAITVLPPPPPSPQHQQPPFRFRIYLFFRGKHFALRDEKRKAEKNEKRIRAKIYYLSGPFSAECSESQLPLFRALARGGVGWGREKVWVIDGMYIWNNDNNNNETFLLTILSKRRRNYQERIWIMHLASRLRFMTASGWSRGAESLITFHLFRRWNHL